jgi:hypothetical protein
MNKPTPRRRTIDMPEPRSRQVALAAAFLGISSEAWIQSVISAGLLALSQNDATFALALARSAGVSWENLEKIAKLNAEQQ